MDHSQSPFEPANGGTAAWAAAACGLAAIVIAMTEALTSVLQNVPFPMALPVLGLCAIAFCTRDASLRKQFEAQAHRHNAARRELEAKNHWFTITEGHARVGHWRLSLTTNEVFWSDATFAIHGLESGNPPSLHDAINFYHEDDRQIVTDNIEKARVTGQPYTFRARIITKDGELRHVDAGATVECAADGTPTALFGVIKDRTGEESMQAELRVARDEARALALSKGQFLARMNHEIRTPMNGLLGFAELLELSDLTAEQRRHTQLIIDSGKNLQTLLNDILDLSKIEAGKTEILYADVDIQTLLLQLKEMADPLAREKRIKLVCDIAPSMPRKIETDALRLRQILSNLISNAVRFTDVGIVSMTAHSSDGTLYFSVTDTGKGIAADMREKIFDPLLQDQTNPTSLKSGTGLGLAISRQLAELMGGGLTVRSEFGEGSIFTLTLPDRAAFTLENPSKPEPPTAEKPAPAAKTASPLKPQTKLHSSGRILLVDDFEINRELMIDMTRELGVAVECAEDGAEAVTAIHHAQAADAPFALVFMDLQMPRMDGLEAARRIRADGFGEDELPILALTANAFADDVENCLAAGMQAHLAKPLSMETLRETLTKWAPDCFDTAQSSSAHDTPPGPAPRKRTADQSGGR